MIARGICGLILIAWTAGAEAAGEPLQTWVLQEPLGRRWTDELVHFPFAVAATTAQLAMTDERGTPLPCQITDAKTVDGKLRGSVWTVVSLEPGQTKTFHLVATGSVSSSLAVTRQAGMIELGNGRIALRLADWTEAAASPVALLKLPGPIQAFRGTQGAWLGSTAWSPLGGELRVKRASSEILERGPIRARVRQQLTLDNGQTYEALVELAAGQEVAVIREQSTIESPHAGYRLALQSGLGADRVLWHNQWKETTHAKSWGLTTTAVDFTRESTVCRLRPWSFWWLGDLTAWAGFYRQGAEPLVGVLMLRPSQWSPGDWDGFDHTEIPVSAGPGPKLELTFSLAAGKQKKDGALRFVPLRRQWALTVGSVKDHVPDGSAKQSPAASVPKLRRQLIQHSEFPLDEVKDYGFENPAPSPTVGQISNPAPSKAGKAGLEIRPTDATPSPRHPFLILTPRDVQRVRRQANTVPVIRETAEAARRYVLQATGSQRTLETEGPEAFYRKNYVGNYLVEKLPEIYLASDEPVFGRMMAAAVKGLAQDAMDTFVEAPVRPALGAYGPWYSEAWMRLVLNYDLIAGSGLLSPAEETRVRNVLVFGAHVLSHPDYWNTSCGLCSANPNMTNSIVLPRGMLALFLAGHPRSAEWLRDAEQELQGELQGWVSPGGAWVENPGYQAASLDSMFLLAQAIRNVQGKDYFADPQFKATMDYYGFILTPPDRRFPPRSAAKPDAKSPEAEKPAPMTLPAIGDGFAGFITSFPGWMAKATAATDPGYSARQQFYWKTQHQYLGSAGRAKGLTMALTDPELPAAPPSERIRGFPGFGSVLRSSWTDPKASYVIHRTGPNIHHYHDEFNSILFYARGVPLCVDFGNCYAPLRRAEPWYHSRVSWDKPDSPTHYGSSGELLQTVGLATTAGYSHGRSWGGGAQQDHRHVLLVPPRAGHEETYVVIRDATVDGQPKQQFFFNLWCLSQEPVVRGSVVRFPGQFGVDLDVHVLSPAHPSMQKDHWQYGQHIYVWGQFQEEQYGIRVAKDLSKEDFVTVLRPRPAGAAEARVQRLADGAALRVETAAGTDLLLFSPGKAGKVQDGDVTLEGEIALARHAADGTTTLALLKAPASGTGEAAKNSTASATCGAWCLRSSGPVAVTIGREAITGESSGEAHEALLTIPAGCTVSAVSVDGKPVTVSREGRIVVVRLPAGEHTFALRLAR